MRSGPSALRTHLAAGSAKTAWCYRITVKASGASFLFTEGDVPVTFSEGVFEPYPGLLGGTISYALAQASVIDIQLGITEATPLTRTQVRDGFLDAAEVDIWEYDLDHPTYGRMQIFWGRVGDITRRAEGGVTLQVKGILDQAYEILVQHYHPMCLWWFCDDRCGLPAADFTYAATITDISSDRYTLGISGPAAARPDNVFQDGVATILSGERAGINVACRGNSGETLLMHLAMPRALQVGDTLEVLQGCQKRAVDCKAYGNYLRFGGFDKAGSSEDSASITYTTWPSS